MERVFDLAFVWSVLIMRIYIIGQQGEKQHVWHFQGVTLSRKKAIRACVTPKFFYFETKLGKLFGIAPSKAKDAGIVPVFPLKEHKIDFPQFWITKTGQLVPVGTPGAKPPKVLAPKL
jgi:hypothetical protein